MKKLLWLSLCWLLVSTLVGVGGPPAADAAAPVTAHGTITDEAGVPVAHLKVFVYTGDTSGQYSIASGRTDETGAYEMQFTSADAAFGADVRVVDPRYYVTRRLIGNRPGRTYTADLVVTETPVISGTVRDAGGTPIDDVELTAVNTVPGGDCPAMYYDGEQDRCDSWDHATTTAADGSFAMRIDAGTLFSLALRRAGYETAILHDVAPGDVLDVVLTPGSATNEMTVSGTVTDETGTPVSNTYVSLEDPEYEVDDFLPETYADGYTDVDGHYELTVDLAEINNPELGVDVLVSTPEDHAWPVGEVSVGHYLEPGDYTVDVPLGPAATVVGSVRSPDGLPAADAVVSVAVGYDRQQVDVDPDGRFTMEVFPGRFTVYASGGAPFGRGRADGVVAPGAPVSLTIDLHTPTPIDPEPPAPDPDVTVPAQPQRIRAEAIGSGRARVAFAPAYSGGRSIKKFQASCARRGEDIRASARRSAVVVSGLTAGARYRCRVRAKNALGWSDWSAKSDRFRTPAR